MGREIVEISAAVLLRELAGGGFQATSIADFDLISFGTELSAVDQQRRYLESHLLDAPAARIARFEPPPHLELIEVVAKVHRMELPPSLRRPLPIAVPVIVAPANGGAWGLVPWLGQAIWCSAREDREAIFAAEIERLLAAADRRELDIRRLLPGEDDRIETVEVELLISAEGVSGRAALARKKMIAEHRRKLATETLEKAGARLSPRRSPGPALIGRDRELTALAALIGGAARASVLVVGDEGAGKSELVRACVDRCPRRMVVATSVAQLVAGASGFGEWQQRVHEILEAAETLDAVLYFDNLGELFGEHPEAGGVDVAGLLRPAVVNERVRIAGEITAAALERARRHQVALLSAFASVRLEPLDEAETLEAVDARIEWWRRIAEDDPSQPSVDPGVSRPLVDLAERYLPYRANPGKAIGLLEELRATRAHIRDAEGRSPPITIEDCYDAFAVATRIPRFLIREDQPLEIAELERAFRRRMIGQNEAIRAVAETICTVKARMAPADKPLSTFLFVGPTGVGKTELARSLADILFGADDRLVRFDMSEYTDPLAAERLIRGAGSRDGLMTTRVREQPFCAVLLDEIEKAHPAVHDLLLQVCGSGRLTDARGRTTFFHNAIIIMTSNLGAAHRAEAIGPAREADDSALAEHYRRAVRAAFRPEMLNRIDRLVSFAPLSAAEVARVTELALARIAERRGFLEAGIAIEVSDAAVAALARGGYSETYGVRALRRHLDDHLVTPIAHQLARLGAACRGARVWVGLASEATDPPGQRLATTTAGELAIEFHRRPGSAGRVTLRGVAAAAELRRRADQLMALDEAAELRQRLSQLRAELAQFNAPKKGRGRKKREARRAAEIAELQSTHHRYRGAWEPVLAARDDLWAAEELAITSVLEGADASAWTDEVRATFAAFQRRFFWVLVADRRERDQCALRLRRVGGLAPISLWLAPLLAFARDRGWSVEGRLPASVPGSPPREKEGHHWGRPMAMSRLETEVESAADAIRQLLLLVRGRDAGILLPPERGLHRFDGYSTRDEGDHLLVDLIDVPSGHGFSDFQLSNVSLATPPPKEISRKAGADRARSRGSSEVVVAGTPVEIGTARGGYFESLEAIGLVALLAARDEDGIAAVYNGSFSTPIPKTATNDNA